MRQRLRLSIVFSTCFVVSASGVALMSCSASAADADLLTPRKVGLNPVSTDWTGLYIGGEGGTGWGTDQLFFPARMTGSSRLDTSGAIAGGVVGFNWQVPAGDWVVGLETNINWVDVKATGECPNVTYSCTTKLTDLVTGTARVGYARGSALFYVKGGFAAIRERAYPMLLSTGAIPASGTTDRGGYTLGTGVEYMFAPNWAAKVEYDYYSFDSKRMNLSTSGGTIVDVVELASRSLNTVKAGINYHFNWHPPFALARY